MKGAEAAGAAHSFLLTSFPPQVYAHGMKGDHRTAGSYTTSQLFSPSPSQVGSCVRGNPEGQQGQGGPCTLGACERQ